MADSSDLDEALEELLSEVVEDLKEGLRKMLAAEYHRGEQDAAARIMKAAQDVGNDEDDDDVAVKERAPRGTAKALIDRVLRERGQRGATASEIAAAANTDTEKLASFSSIRLSLTVGRDDGIYRNQGGRWYPVKGPMVRAAEQQVSVAPPINKAS